MMALNLNKNKIGRKIVLFALICGALGAVGAFKPLTLGLYVLQTKAAVKPVSGDIVVVGIDAPSINRIGRWPWPRDVQAELLRKIDSYQPKAVYVDLAYQGKTTPSADLALREALEGMDAPTRVIAIASGTDGEAVQSIFSDVAAIGSTKAVSVYLPYLFSQVWEIPTRIDSDRGPLDSAAVSMAQLDVQKEENFRIDYTYDPNTIPEFSAKNVIYGSVDPAALKGKTVIIGMTDISHNDVHSMPGWGDRPGVEFHVMAAESLKAGMPKEIGWPLLFLLGCIFGGLLLTQKGLHFSRAVVSSGILVTLALSTWLSAVHIGNDSLPALSFLLISGIYVSRQKAALVRSQRNAQTGFSDMTGYKVKEVFSNNLFIAASFSRAETQRGYILADDEMKIIKEVGRRLSTVIDERQLTHNDHQQFLWEMPLIATNELAAHLEGLRQMFIDPLIIDGRKIDIYIFFGVDRDVTSNVNRRMDSALRASEEACETAATFKIATSTSYERHFVAQFGEEFDTAITNGDIRVLLEAQPNLADGAVQSAEVAIKWTHPAYGQIATDKMFKLALNSGSLKKISLFLCDQAAIHAGQLRNDCSNFAVSVKISTEILLAGNFQKDMLAAVKSAGCEPENIVFEIVDVHSHKHSADARQAIGELQKHGFRVGIGNFGATNSDMDLLQIFRPDEIFLIKSFSAELLGSTSNQIFADGVLRIARATRIVSTADGIDDRDVLSALRNRGCDRGKGKIIATPLELRDFIATHLRQENKKVG